MSGKNFLRPFSSCVLIIFTFTVILGLTAVPAQAAGETGWYSQRLESGDYDCVAVGDADNVWVGTGGGDILKTTDGGDTWNTQFSLGPDSAIFDIAAVNKDKAWAVGYSGQSSGILRTIDGGVNWNLVWYYDSPKVVTCISALNDMTAWAGGAGIIKTGNGGLNWELQYVPEVTHVVRDIAAVTSQLVWAACTDGIFKTSNGGSNWERKYDLGVKAISASDSTHAWAVQDTYILNTTDGNSWSIVHSIASSTALNGVAAASASAAWAVGLYSTILKTTDSGANWERQYPWPPDNLRDVAAFDTDTVWAVGDKGIFHTTDGGAGNGPRPYINSIGSTQGRPGQSLVINGERFGDERGSSSYVSFGTVPASSYSDWRDYYIVCEVPPIDPMPSTVQVTVTTPYGTSNSFAYTVNPPPLPVSVGAIWPPLGLAGSGLDVIIMGSGFQQGATVYFSGSMYGWGSVTVSNVYVFSDMIITCHVQLPPYNPQPTIPPVYPFTSYSVHVLNPDGGYSPMSVTLAVIAPTCGAGAGTGVIAVGLLMGTLSLGSAVRVRRRRRRANKKK